MDKASDFDPFAPSGIGPETPNVSVNGEAALQGLRVLVVEDAFSMALVLETALTAVGCSVLGPAARLEKAWPLVEQEFDGAILDVDLDGEEAYPLAVRLRERGVPFILTTGYEATSLHPDFRDAPRIEKPFEVEALIAMMAQVFVPKQA